MSEQPAGRSAHPLVEVQLEFPVVPCRDATALAHQYEVYARQLELSVVDNVLLVSGRAGAGPRMLAGRPAGLWQRRSGGCKQVMAGQPLLVASSCCGGAEEELNCISLGWLAAGCVTAVKPESDPLLDSMECDCVRLVTRESDHMLHLPTQALSAPLPLKLHVPAFYN